MKTQMKDAGGQNLRSLTNETPHWLY